MVDLGQDVASSRLRDAKQGAKDPSLSVQVAARDPEYLPFANHLRASMGHGAYDDQSPNVVGATEPPLEQRRTSGGIYISLRHYSSIAAPVLVVIKVCLYYQPEIF